MKKASILINTISSLLLIGHAQSSEIQFDMLAINSDAGKLYVQLFKGKENYTKGKALASSVVEAKVGDNTVVFDNIEQGEYAIRFFHDENGNGKLETNFIGMPTEGYGFSNDAKPSFGPAKYKDMKFAVTAESKVIVNQSSAIY